VVGVDGWSRIINGHPQFDGMDFEQDEATCTCIIYRKDRSHPVRVTEYMAECRRANVGPWQSHPKRMLRHKAMIQCARIAFGYAGIYDQDEAERIGEVRTVDPATGEIITNGFDVNAAIAEVKSAERPGHAQGTLAEAPGACERGQGQDGLRRAQDRHAGPARRVVQEPVDDVTPREPAAVEG
jgi:hypothetical protein